ncbi:MAG: hypothetical protein Q9162_002708 [Coniocarpon cinnabarinum]
MAPPLELSIPNHTNTTQDSKTFTLYQISIRQPLRSYTVPKRYSDFSALDAALSQIAPPPVSLPPKTWLKSTTSSPELAEERRAGLERYLRAIVDASDGQWRDATVFKTFLNLPTTSAKGAISSTAGRLGNATIIDPNVWLDVHRDLKSQLRSARQAVTRRDTATDAKNQHESAAEAKSCLIRAGGMMSALDGGLKTLSSPELQSNSGGSKLGEGEIRRRKDLLASATKEKEAVQEALSASISRHNFDATPSDAPSDTSTNRDALLSPSKPVRKTGRTLGAAPETDETRVLDNEGVAQLQVQKMRDQDQDVEVLTSTVRRMREMGVQIHDELQLQNEMLDVLGADADRVQKKIDVGRRRADKIK